jgi:hypothetical protein
MDGQDLKPIWERWLGVRLERMANRLYPIDYCVYKKCKFYNRAKYDFPMIQEQYETLISEMSKMHSLNSHVTITIKEEDIQRLVK